VLAISSYFAAIAFLFTWVVLALAEGSFGSATPQRVLAEGLDLGDGLAQVAPSRLSKKDAQAI
jgi:hypothetical protein